MTQWLRWWHGTATDPKWRTVSRRAGQPIPNVLAVWCLLLESASENATERGRTHEWSNEVAGDALGIEPATVGAIVDAMQGLVLDGDKLAGWEKRQPKREDGGAERAKAWRENARERKRTQRNAPEQSRAETEQKEPPPPSGAPPLGDQHDDDRRRGTRLAGDWQPSAEDIAFAAGLGLDPDRVAPEFRDFWHGKPGKDGRKCDWSATWRNRCRQIAGDVGRPRANGNGQPAGGIMDAAARVIARRRGQAVP